jgi:FkbM family methyltransferase
VKYAQKRCIVISAGSNNVFDFEVDILNHTSCVVHVFDCTVEAPSLPDDKIIYHDWCLGEFNGENSDELAKLRGVEKVQMRTLLSSMKELSLTNIEVLKIDIEGSEWGVLQNTFYEVKERTRNEFLPRQIAIELHFENSMESIDSVAALSYDLHCLGYVVVYIEPNKNCGGCAEILFAKLFE